MNQRNDLVSVVVPVYNVELYLEKCIKSIIEQTYINLEIILVNDGSTDSSLEICQRLAEIDNRIRIINKSNGGLSDARNKGISNAKGDYVICIDSDDFISREMIEVLIANANKYSADVSCCHFTNVYRTSSFPQYSDVNKSGVVGKEEFLEAYLYDSYISSSMCTKMVKRDIASKIQYEVGKLYEDAFYHLELVKVADTFAYSTAPLYHYFHRENSITTSKYRKNNMHVIEAYERFYDFVELNYPRITDAAYFKKVYAYFGVLDKIIFVEHFKEREEYVSIRGFFKKNLFKIFSHPKVSFSRKLSLIPFLISVSLYRKIVEFEKKQKKNIN